MPKNRKNLIAQLIKEGFTHGTLSSFSDNQIKVLRDKLLGEGLPEEISNAEKQLADLKLAQSEKNRLFISPLIDIVLSSLYSG